MESFQTAASVAPARVEWLWADRIPGGMVSLVAGNPGTGKSLFAVFLAAQVSQMGAGVVLATREDPSREVVRPRLEVAGADLSRVAIWTPERELERQRLALRQEIKKREARLVIIDPVAAFLASSVYNDQAVRSAISPLARLAEETGCAILLITHLVKARSRNVHPLNAIGGSGAGLVAASRAVFVFGKDPEDDSVRVLAPAKANLGPERPSLSFEIVGVDYATGPTARLELVGETHVGASDLVSTQAVDANRTAPQRDEAAAFLREALKAGPQLVSRLKMAAAERDIKWGTLRRAADDLGVIRPRGGANSAWQLAELAHDEHVSASEQVAVPVLGSPR